MKTTGETAKRLDAIATELKELSLSLRGEGEMRADVKKPATPKEGEFWYVRTVSCSEYIYCKQGQRFLTSKLYSLRLDINQVSYMCECICFDSDIAELRPATKEEKQILIKAVEKEHNKTFNGKEWVDMKPEFKKGDYVYGGYEGYWSINIFGTNIVLFNAAGLQINDDDSGYNPLRIATTKECQTFDNALAKAGKRYNPETQGLEDIIK